MQPPSDPNVPDIAIYRLNEGFVLNVSGTYTVALTTADDLAERVRTVASAISGEAQFSEPSTSPTSITHAAPTPSSQPSAELKEATAVPSPRSEPEQPLSLETEWQNARKLMAFMAAGFDTNGRAFLRKDFDAALPMFCPHLDSKEVEFELSEFLAELHDDD